MGNYESHESWYERRGCLDVKSLMPLFIVYIGVLVQALFAFLITFESENDKDTVRYVGHGMANSATLTTNGAVKEHKKSKSKAPPANSSTITRTESPSACACCTSYKNSQCGTIFVKCLIVWQICSMLVIFALDVNNWFIWEDKQDAIDNDTNTWENYQCFSAMVITSSNYKTVVVNFSFMLLNRDWQDPFRIAWNLAVWFLFIFYFLWMLMYGLAGTILYIYLVIPVLPLMYCGYLCFSCCTDDSVKFFLHYILPIFVIDMCVILSLTCVNWFSGELDYWVSFELVIFEREYVTYLLHLGDPEAIFRMFTSFFG